MTERDRRPIVFHCDAVPATGLGHLSRCLGLAEAFAELGETVLFLGSFGAGAQNLLVSAGVTFRSLPPIGSSETFAALKPIVASLSPALIVVDSYLIDESYCGELMSDGSPLLLIDDFGRLKDAPFTGLLNFTVGARGVGYRSSERKCFLGPEYFLARRPLRLARRGARVRRGSVNRVVVAMGGADRTGLAGRVVEALSETFQYGSVKLINGGDAAEFSGRLPAGWEVMPQLPDLGKCFEWADACICAGGLTKYEAAYLGVPAAVLSQNVGQSDETKRFAECGLAKDLGLASETGKIELLEGLTSFLDDEAGREAMSAAGLSVFPVDPTITAAKNVLTMAREAA